MGTAHCFRYLKSFVSPHSDYGDVIWDKKFKSGLSEFRGRQHLKKLKGYGIWSHIYDPIDDLPFNNSDQYNQYQYQSNLINIMQLWLKGAN